MTQVSCACANLNEPEVNKRRTLGYGSFVAAFALVGLNKVQTPPLWALWMPTVPFFFGYLNLMQAKSKTCVALALADRDMSEGELRPVKDRETGWRLKKRSYKIIAGAGVLAAVSAAICMKL
jgi:hypothetical protein